jgi:hypothetical protein
MALLQFDRTIKAGDVLTSLTILISAVTLVVSLAKDRQIRVTEQANRVRDAAAHAIVKLDRWQSLQLSLYQELQPLFVELSEDLARQYDVVATRDRFWRQANEERTRVARQVLDEQLGTAYLEILSHFPAARTRYVAAFSELALVEHSVVEGFLARSEQAILGLQDGQATYQTARLGNALRAQASTATSRLKEQSDAVIWPARDYLLSVIALPDKEIVSASRVDRSP